MKRDKHLILKKIHLKNTMIIKEWQQIYKSDNWVEIYQHFPNYG